MSLKRSWTLQSLLSCLILNAVLVSLFFVMAKEVLAAVSHWVTPFSAGGGANLPPEASSAFTGLHQLLGETQGYLASVVFGLGTLVTLILWLLLLSLGGRLLARAAQEVSATAPAVSMSADPGGQQATPARGLSPEAQPWPQASPQSAVQMLAILQREGRLIDFLGEDLRPYTDDQIGAAVRSIHQGCQAALHEHLELKPIVEELEGAEITVPHDFDANAIRLTGNVSGDPPFKGTLRHHGWRVIRIDLPQMTTLPREKGWILAPAEVEIAE
jgi:hypothetical protein